MNALRRADFSVNTVTFFSGKSIDVPNRSYLAYLSQALRFLNSKLLSLHKSVKAETFLQTLSHKRFVASLVSAQ